MGALTDLNDLINRLSGGNSGTPEHVWFAKWASVNGTNNTQGSTAPMPLMSLWLMDGIPGGSAATFPGAASIPDRTTNGGLKQANPGGGRQKWLTGIDVAGVDAGGGQNHYTYLLYDRLFHMSGLSGTTTTPQTVQGTSPSPALTRYTSGDGNFAMYEIYSAVGTTATTIQGSYTDQAGNTGHTFTKVPIGGAVGTGVNGQCGAFIFPLAAGDTGVRAVKDVTLTASTVSAAGDFGITIGHPLALISVNVAGGSGGGKDGISVFPSITEIPTDACLALLQVNNTSATWNGRPLFGFAHFLEA